VVGASNAVKKALDAVDTIVSGRARRAQPPNGSEESESG
jgi:hypothetical protein